MNPECCPAQLLEGLPGGLNVHTHRDNYPKPCALAEIVVDVHIEGLWGCALRSPVLDVNSANLHGSNLQAWHQVVSAPIVKLLSKGDQQADLLM